MVEMKVDCWVVPKAASWVDLMVGLMVLPRVDCLVG